MYQVMTSVAIFIVLKSANHVQSSASWVLETRPVILGHNIVMKCFATNCSHADTKHWMGGADQSVLCINGKSENPKYRMTKLDAQKGFSLILRNVSLKDLTYSYTCVCGFHSFDGRINISSEEIIALPSKEMVIDNTEVYAEILDVNFTLLHVSREPNCIAYFQGQHFEVKLVDQFSVNDTFKNINYRQNVVILKGGTHRLKVECMSTGHRVLVIDTNIDCKIKTGFESLPIILGVCIGLVVCMGILIYCVKRAKVYGPSKSNSRVTEEQNFNQTLMETVHVEVPNNG